MSDEKIDVACDHCGEHQDIPVPQDVARQSSLEFTCRSCGEIDSLDLDALRQAMGQAFSDVLRDATKGSKHITWKPGRKFR